MLLQIPALFSPDEVREIRALLESAEWVDGRVTAGHRAVSVKDNLQIPLDHPVSRQLGERILERLAVTPLFIAAALPLRILPPRFNRYEGGGTYGNHVDNAVFPVPGTPVRVRTDVSTTIFFSDPDEYDGGELVVEDTFGEKHVKLPAGDAIVYPGSSLHRVTPVTSGTRFASFFWTQSLIRDDRQRRMLFELDGAIQQLTADHPDHPSIDSFTNTYHNLMRGWSET
ncbi:Fe2+-dependent dioxygenase [Altererythrobacter fulvus]|uniref:Fe2+-dependent dioxygenase n=1 Tax=Caenibius fulvus TaxID=2126012 RepID=UPI00301A6966